MMKLDTINMCMLNSLPSHLKPFDAISNASLPKPLPGTKTFTSFKLQKIIIYPSEFYISLILILLISI